MDSQVGRDAIVISGNVILPTPPVRSLHQLRASIPDFTGREEQLAELTDAVLRGGTRLVALLGMGGIGKTALALELAHRLQPHFIDAQFFIDLHGVTAEPLSLIDAMAQVIRAYYPDARLSSDYDELLALYQSVLHGKRVLLLLDNAANAPQVEPLIPATDSLVIVTSRQHFALPGLMSRTVEPLPACHSRALLLGVAPRIGDHADAMADLCGHLPLALRLACGALASRRDLRPEDYLGRLSDGQERLQLIEKSLRLSYQLLSPQLRKAWCLLALFQEQFDRAAAAEVWGLVSDQPASTLSELTMYSLVEWDADSDLYQLHDLARLFADARLAEADCSLVAYDPDRHYDLRVVIHDGGPKMTMRQHEYMWVRLCGRRGSAYVGLVLNVPHALQTVRLGDAVQFLVPVGWTYPLRVTEKYLAERDQWLIRGCEQCGLSELFDPPSELIRKSFSNLSEGETMLSFTQFCPWCGKGSLILRLKPEYSPDEQPESTMA